MNCGSGFCSNAPGLIGFCPMHQPVWSLREVACALWIVCSRDFEFYLSECGVRPFELWNMLLRTVDLTNCNAGFDPAKFWSLQIELKIPVLRIWGLDHLSGGIDQSSYGI